MRLTTATASPGCGCGRVEAISAAYRSPLVTSEGTANDAATVAEALFASCNVAGVILIHDVSSLPARPGSTVQVPFLIVAAAGYMSIVCGCPVLFVTRRWRTKRSPGLTTSTT